MEARPYVKPPSPIRDRGVAKNLRQGRGFSICEIEKAGLGIEKAKSMGVRIDARRRSCHEWNVKILRELLASH